MSKKHEDFDRALQLQESKVVQLNEAAENLINSSHSKSDLIAQRRDEIFARWKQLKDDMVQKHKEVGEIQTLQEFWKTADEYSEWLDEKIVIAEQPINETNLNQGFQRHKAFIFELDANKDRLQTILKSGEEIAAKNSDQTHLIQDKSDELRLSFDKLNGLVETKTKNYEEAEKLRQFLAACKALDYWIIETRTKLESSDAKDLQSAQNNLKALAQLQTDINGKTETRDELKQSYDNINEDERCLKTRQKLDDDFDAIFLLAESKRVDLERQLASYQFISDANEETDWCREKTHLANKDETGNDLAQAESFSSKHKRLEFEFDSRKNKIDSVIMEGTGIGPAVVAKVEQLTNARNDLDSALDKRRDVLSKALDDLHFVSTVDEEIAWTGEKIRMIDMENPQTQLEAVRDQLQKLENLKIDIESHKSRTAKLKERRPNDPRLEQLMSKIVVLEDKFSNKKKEVESNESFLNFKRKCQYCNDWIQDRLRRLAAENITGDDMAMVSAFLTKQDNLEDSLKAYESEGITPTRLLREQLIKDTHPNSDEIQARWSEIEQMWRQLVDSTGNRRELLQQHKQKLREYEDLCIEFARKAGAFNSWYENIEENLTDPVRSRSIEEVESRFTQHEVDTGVIAKEESKLVDLRKLDEKIRIEAQIETNPYTWFTMDELEEIWMLTSRRLEDRKIDLDEEKAKQVRYDQMRQQFAEFANKFGDFITGIRSKLNAINSGTLEEQLQNVVQQERVVRESRTDLDLIEKLNNQMEIELVFDNIYTAHSALGLSQSWDGILQMCQRLQRSLKTQIEARSKTGISEERIQEWRECFDHFDRDGGGMLDHIELKSLFRSLGIELPLKEGDQETPEFVIILQQMNPSCESAVTKDEFINHMLTRETTQVKGKDDIVAAFKAIADPAKAFITEEELRKHLNTAQADYCIRVMPKYQGNILYNSAIVNKIDLGPDASLDDNVYDYHKFINEYFK